MIGSHHERGTGYAFVGGAVGLALGLLMNPARKLAVQTPTMLKGNWAEALAAEHQATLKVLHAAENTGDDDATRRGFHLMQLKHMIGKHSFQEENTVYAMMRARGLLDPAKHLNEDHAEVKRVLFELTRMPKSDPQWLAKMGELRTMLEEHMREEETEHFPKLRGALSEDENAELAKAMNKEGLKLA